MTHFYHVGSTEDLRNSMEEALLIKPGHAAPIYKQEEKIKPAQIAFALEHA